MAVPEPATEILNNGGHVSAAAEQKKARESERRRRRRKQKKNSSKKSSAVTDGSDDDANESSDQKPEVEVAVEIEYVPEKAEIDDDFLEEFKHVLEKFISKDASAGAEDDAKNDEAAENTGQKKKNDSDSDSEEEQDTQQRDKGISNKKKKLLRRMKIADLKQICSRPDVVEVWDATAADPRLLVFLKSYRNTVPVPRHWSQKRKFLQGTSYHSHGAGHSGI